MGGIGAAKGAKKRDDGEALSGEESEGDERYRLGTGRALIVVLFGLGIFLPAIGGRVTMTRHEVLAAQPAREMVQYGHWIMPTFAGKPRLVKPPMMGWLIAMCMEVSGRETEWVARLPSVIAAVVVGLTMAMLGARMGGATLGLIAGLTQLTFYYILMQGRLAEADMALAACVTVAMYQLAVACAGAKDSEDDGGGPSIWRQRVACVAAGIGFALKGPVALALIFPAVVIFLIAQPDRNRWRFLVGPVGWIVLLAMCAAWPLEQYREYPAILHTWAGETFGRARGDLIGEDYHAWWFYGPIALALLAPWTPWTIGGIYLAWRRGDFRRPMGKFLTAWFVAGLVVLSAMAWKHKHYLIPAMPALTLATATGIAWWLRDLRRTSRQWGAVTAMIVVAACVVAVLVVERVVKQAAEAICILIGMVGVGGLLVLLAARMRSARGQIAALFGTAGVVALAAQIWVMPAYDVYAGWADLGKRAAATVPAGQTTYLLGLEETEAAFYLNFPMQRCDTGPEVRATFGAMREGAWALAVDSMLPVLRDLGNVRETKVWADLKLPDRRAARVELVYFWPVRAGLAAAR